MTDWSRLSLNTATCKPYTLAECVAAAQAAGLGAVGPWRDRVQEVGAGTAASLIADAGLRVSSLCRGGFITARDEDVAAQALADNRLAIDEAAALGARGVQLAELGMKSSCEGRRLDVPEIVL